MKVYMTQPQKAALDEAVLRMEMTGDTLEVIGLLASCSLDNGGDFDPRLARLVPTEIIVDNVNEQITA